MQEGTRNGSLPIVHLEKRVLCKQEAKQNWQQVEKRGKRGIRHAMRSSRCLAVVVSEGKLAERSDVSHLRHISH